MQRIKTQLWSNEEAGDWSVEINGLRLERVTGEIMEDLVECVLIVAESSLTAGQPLLSGVLADALFLKHPLLTRFEWFWSPCAVLLVTGAESRARRCNTAEA